MPPVILTLLQGLFLLLLYVFVARAVRAVLRDLSGGPAPRRRLGKASPRTQAGARRRRPPPRELVVTPPDLPPQVVPLNGGSIVFGRSPSCTVALDDPYVSDEHARVYLDGQDWLVADQGSTNGTYLNQEKVTTPIRVSAGDTLTVGKTVIELRR